MDTDTTAVADKVDTVANTAETVAEPLDSYNEELYNACFSKNKKMKSSYICLFIHVLVLSLQ